ncbi:hypothetical protein GCK72_003402 [Caenorhabditis remanei]|uniref:Uncharacterized protein n=1 Tax=Caenorhabditis remanei TaxID=31234 RepID=A0A6A5HV98_CAERE|nr:hypothetical protein GCK72_003402 [Caenorhabditis remanei]KAF1771575.1 hypothetical protein GCK72_003402 [Caenorhabditis remanei]
MKLVDIKKLDSSTKTPVYLYNNISYNQADKVPVELPIRTYVVRDCDQIVASVHIEEKKMVLGVWNMTESNSSISSR